MADKQRLDEELIELERELAALSPRPSGVDASRMLYLAGRESAITERLHVARQSRHWPAATMAMSIVAATLLVLWQSPQPPRIVEKIVYVDRHVEYANDDIRDTAAAQLTTANADDEFDPVASWVEDNSVTILHSHYLRDRQIALTRGIDRLPSPVFHGGDPTQQTYRELQQSLLGRASDGRGDQL